MNALTSQDERDRAITVARSLLSLGGHLAATGAIAVLAATMFWSERLWFDWYLVAADKLFVGLLYVFALLWGGLSVVIFIQDVRTLYPGERTQARAWKERAIFAVLLPFLVVPFYSAGNARTVADCDRWWAGLQDEASDRSQCWALARSRGYERMPVPQASPATRGD